MFFNTLKILFLFRWIFKGPLSTIQNLSYYTVRLNNEKYMLIKEEIKNKYASFVSYLFYYFRPDIIKITYGLVDLC